MSLPTLSKTWQYNINGTGTGANNTAAMSDTYIGIKNAMIGFASSPWAMRYSCGGGVAGTAGDGVDRITSTTSITYNNAGSSHSWFVLRQTGIATNFEMCMEFVATANAPTIIVSPSVGFAGGTTTSRPTATDEIPISGVSLLPYGNQTTFRFNVIQSTDGQCTRIITAASGSTQTILAFEKPANPTSGWTNPSVFIFPTSMAVATLAATSGNAARMRNGSTNGNVLLTVEGTAGGTAAADTNFGNLANEIDGAWPMWPIGLACITAGLRGRHGTLFDLWLGSSAAPSGDMYPNDASNQFAQFSNIIIPWGGNVAPALT